MMMRCISKGEGIEFLEDIYKSVCRWGIDIVGILPRAPGGFRYSFIGIDTFTK
jgi:hypothetical protein